MGRLSNKEKARRKAVVRRQRYVATHREELAIKRDARKKLLHELKDHPCTDCKQSFPPYVMDFDHVRGVKLGAPGMMVFGDFDKFLEEIAKCELVCANCHRIRTHKK